MAKIQLGKRPASFKSSVKFPMLDGTTGVIEIGFRYRTRKEFGLFIDELVGQSEDNARPDGEKFSLAANTEKTAKANADYIMQCVDSWNVDAELNHENVEQLAYELPAAAAAIMESYRAAIEDGRLKN